MNLGKLGRAGAASSSGTIALMARVWAELPPGPSHRASLLHLQPSSMLNFPGGPLSPGARVSRSPVPSAGKVGGLAQEQDSERQRFGFTVENAPCRIFSSASSKCGRQRVKLKERALGSRHALKNQTKPNFPTIPDCPLLARKP